MIVNLLGFLLIALIIWWFWLYEPKNPETNDERSVAAVEEIEDTL